MSESSQIHITRCTAHTSSPGNICFNAITCMSGSAPFRASPFGRGKTTTAFGSQEWLIRATEGDTHAPRGSNEGVEMVKVFVVN